MKNVPIALSILLLTATVTTTQALDLSKFTDKATSIVDGVDAAGSSDLLSMGTDLLTSFKGNDQAVSAVKGLLNTFKNEQFANSFDYYDQIKAAGLKPSQLQTWNDVKNPISAMILERNFNFKEAGLSDLVSKASSSLKGNDTKGATSYLSQLKDAASLTSGQKSLLQNIQSNLLPVK